MAEVQSLPNRTWQGAFLPDSQSFNGIRNVNQFTTTNMGQFSNVRWIRKTETREQVTTRKTVLANQFDTRWNTK
jgi:hypothetical protein